MLILVLCGPLLARANVSDLLREADLMRSANPAQFAELLELAKAQESKFTLADKELFDYLQAWKTAYSGHSADAIVLFMQTITKATDNNIVLRARASLMNVLLIAKRPEEAFVELAPLQELLPKATDPLAIDQALMTAALMHLLVAQYDVAIGYTDRVLESSQNATTRCKAGQVKIDALYRAKRLLPDSTLVPEVLNECEAAGEKLFANFVRISLARSQLDSGDAQAAIELLLSYRD